MNQTKISLLAKRANKIFLLSAQITKNTQMFKLRSKSEKALKDTRSVK